MCADTPVSCKRCKGGFLITVHNLSGKEIVLHRLYLSAAEVGRDMTMLSGLIYEKATVALRRSRQGVNLLSDQIYIERPGRYYILLLFQDGRHSVIPVQIHDWRKIFLIACCICAMVALTAFTFLTLFLF